MNGVTAEQQVRMAELRHQEKLVRAERNRLVRGVQREQADPKSSGWAFYSIRLVPALVLLAAVVVMVRA